MQQALELHSILSQSDTNLRQPVELEEQLLLGRMRSDVGQSMLQMLQVHILLLTLVAPAPVPMQLHVHLSLCKHQLYTAPHANLVMLVCIFPLLFEPHAWQGQAKMHQLSDTLCQACCNKLCHAGDAASSQISAILLPSAFVCIAKRWLTLCLAPHSSHLTSALHAHTSKHQSEVAASLQCRANQPGCKLWDQQHRQMRQLHPGVSMHLSCFLCTLPAAKRSLCWRLLCQPVLFLKWSVCCM